MAGISTAAADWSAVAEAWGEAVDYVDEHSAAATTALLDALSVQPGERVLELAAGPGSLVGEWSRLVGDTGRVVVSDIAPGMVDVARRRGADLANVDFAVLDASAIDRGAGVFNVVACRMGLMFASEPAAAFAEIRRVLQPDGRVGALTWGAVEHNPWMTCVGMAAMMNGLVAGGPPTGPGGIFSLSDPTHLESLAKDAGFSNVAVATIDITFQAPSIDAHITRVSSLAGPLAAVFAAATDEQLAAVRHTAAQLAAAYHTTDGLALPGRALLITGNARTTNR